MALAKNMPIIFLAVAVFSVIEAVDFTNHQTRRGRLLIHSLFVAQDSCENVNVLFNYLELHSEFVMDVAVSSHLHRY